MPAYHARVAFNAVSNQNNGALIVNVLHMEVDTLTSPPDWTSIASDIYAWLGLLYNGVLSTFDSLTSIVVTDENYPGSTHGQGEHAAGTTGGRTLIDSKLNPAVCGLVQFDTATHKRYARGHMFAPPLYDSAGLQNFGSLAIGSPYHIALQNFVDALKTGHTAGSTGYVPEIFSRHQVNSGLTPFAFPITAMTVKPESHYLRSRTSAP